MGGWCEDPWLKQVRALGYIPVLLPKTGLVPLRLLKRQDAELRDIGSVLDLFTPGSVQPPEPGADEESVSQRRVQSGKLKAGLGIHLLHGALDMLGVPGSARADYRGAKSLRFTVDGVYLSKVGLVPLDRFLAAADVVADAPTAVQLLTAEELFVCTEVIKAREFTVEVQRSKGSSARVPPVPVHPGVSASADAATNSAGTSRIRYKAARDDLAVVFGLKAVRVRFGDGRYRCLADPPGGLVTKALADSRAEWLASDAPFVGVAPVR
jgi:hypothetical protein